MSQWPEAGSSFTASAFNELAFRAGDSLNLQVVAAAKTWDTFTSKDVSANHPSPNGAYLAAASIYSKLFVKNASTDSSYDHDSDDALTETLANHAETTIQAAAGTAQYSGTYTDYNKFQMTYNRKRDLEYHQNGSSTEEGFERGLTMYRCDEYDPHQAQSLSGGGPVDFNFSRGNDDFETDKQYRVDPALYTRTYGFPMGDHRDNGVGGAITMKYGIDKRFFYQGGALDDGTDLGTVYDSLIDGELPPTYDVSGIPIRLMWAKMHAIEPDMLSHRDEWHLSNEIDRAVGAYMFTMVTGRCPVDAEPPKPADLTQTGDQAVKDWKHWLGRKIGYETAWQMAHMTARVPGFHVVPSLAVSEVTPATTQTLSVSFRYAPTSDVTVNLSVDDTDAGSINTNTLTFTPSNYDTPQLVTVSVGSGTSAGILPFTVSLTTTSDDVVYDGLSDQWAFESILEFAQLSKTEVTPGENGGTDTFTAYLGWEPTSDVVIDLASSNTDEATVSPASLTFTTANWDSPQTVTVTGVDDDTLSADSTSIVLSIDDAASEDSFDNAPDLTVVVTIVEDDAAGFTLSKNSATVDEDGGTDTFHCHSMPNQLPMWSLTLPAPILPRRRSARPA
jgi:hypothetical protein